MTLAEAAAVLKRYSFHGGLRAWGARLWVSYSDAGSITFFHVAVNLTLPDRDTGSPTSVVFNFDLDPLALLISGEDCLVHEFEQNLRTMVLHELDESVQFDGRRVRDAHPDDLKVTEAVVR